MGDAVFFMGDDVAVPDLGLSNFVVFVCFLCLLLEIGGVILFLPLSS